MSSPLFPCSACARHILVTETACPFCGQLNERERATVRPLRGAALLLAGVTAVTACGKTTATTEPNAPDPSSRSTAERPPVPAYGGPPPVTLDPPDASTRNTNEGVPMPAYGAPPPQLGTKDAGKGTKR